MPDEKQWLTNGGKPDAGLSNGRPAGRPQRILITDTNRWPLGPRLATALVDMGCEIAFLCPSPRHPIEATTITCRIFHHSGLHPLRALRSAITEFKPDTVIPLCDRGVQHLHELHAEVRSSGTTENWLGDLIERSTGAPESFPIVSSRYELLRLADSEGILVPKMIAMGEAADLRFWREGTPHWVIKADGTFGGKGVRVATSQREAERLFRQLGDRSDLLGLTKQLLLNRNRGWILSDRKQHRPGVIAQAFIEGRPANIGAVCWQGELLAAICVEVILSQGLTGPATVVQLVPGVQMVQAAERIARRLKLSGFFGLDFVIEDRTGLMYLIEMNPRCTPQCPLPLGQENDLVAAFCSKITGHHVPSRQTVTTKHRIGYFPQSWEGKGIKAGVESIDGVYCDIPEDKGLVQSLLYPWSLRSCLGQLLDRMRSVSHPRKSTAPHMFEDAMLSVGSYQEADTRLSQIRNS